MIRAKHWIFRPKRYFFLLEVCFFNYFYSWSLVDLVISEVMLNYGTHQHGN